MFVWQIKTVQWTRDVVTDASTAGFRSVSVSAWLKKVRTIAIIIPDTEILRLMSLCVNACVDTDVFTKNFTLIGFITYPKISAFVQ